MTSFYIVLAVLVVLAIGLAIGLAIASYNRNSLFWGICAAIVAFLTTVLAILLFTGTLARITSATVAQPTPAAVEVPDLSTPRPSAPGSIEIIPVESSDGRTYFDACNSVGLDDDITALKNNGQVVPNAFMFLDKNETEIAAGDYWFIDVPANVYGHIFFPVTGLTYQVRGPAKLMVGAATFWCDNGGSTPHDGMYQMVDAKRLDEMLLDSFWELTGDGAIGAWVKVPGVEAQPK